MRDCLELRKKESSLAEEPFKGFPAVDESMLFRSPMNPGGAEQLSLFRIEVRSTQDQEAARIQEDRKAPETHPRLVKALKCCFRDKCNRSPVAFPEFQEPALKLPSNT